MYDWANSAFATSGVVAIIPIYFVFLFKEALGEDASFLGITFTGSSMWSMGVAVSTAVVALSSPVLGIIADRAALKKTLLTVYAAAGSLFIGLAFFSAYTSHPWAWLLGMFILANVGFAGSLVFYNSFLPHIAPRNLLDDVSSRGFGYGYVGGGLLLLIHLALILLTRDTDAADLVTRASIASIGVWWFGWALWTLKMLPEPPVHDPVGRLTPWKALSLAVVELGRTLRDIRRFRVVLVYLGAYLLFNDGVQTVISISGAFAADSIGIPLIFNMVTILIVQFVAAGGAMAFAWLARRTATKTALTTALAGWVLIVLAGVAVAPLVPTRHGEFDYQLSYSADAAAYAADAVPELGESHSDSMWREEGHEIAEGELLAPGRAARLLEGVPPVGAFRLHHFDRGRGSRRRDGGRTAAPGHSGGRPGGLVAGGCPKRRVGAAGSGCRLPVDDSGDLPRVGAGRKPGAGEEPVRSDHPGDAKRGVLFVLRIHDQGVGRLRPDALRVHHGGVRREGRGDFDHRHHHRGDDRAPVGGTWPPARASRPPRTRAGGAHRLSSFRSAFLTWLLITISLWKTSLIIPSPSTT